MAVHSVYVMIGDDGSHVVTLTPPEPRTVATPGAPPGYTMTEWPRFRRFDVSFDGPPVLPSGPLTEREFEAWLYGLPERSWGETIHADPAKMAKPLAVPPADARILVRVSAGGSTLHADVENVGGETIPDVSVWSEANWPTPQPGQARGVNYEEVGASEPFDVRDGPADIPPHEIVRFTLRPMYLSGLLSRIASLSPEHYRLRVMSGGTEIGEVTGEELSAAADDLTVT